MGGSRDTGSPAGPVIGGSRRLLVLHLLGAVAVFAGWVVAYRWIVPSLITSAYLQESVPILNNAIQGQARYPLEFYLEAWHRRAGALTPLLAAGLVAAAVWIPIRAHIRRAVRGLFWAEPVVGLNATLGLMACFAFIGGAAEGAIAFAKKLVTTGPQPEVLWMSPVAAALGAAGVGFVAWGVFGRSGLSFRLVLMAAWGYAVYGVVRVVGLGIHPLAGAVLAIGVAAELSRHLKNAARWGRLASQGVTVLLAAALIFATIMSVGERWKEARSIAALSGASEGSPNIILLILDTVRAKSLSLYGNVLTTSPTMDAMGARGVVFDRAIAPTSWTLPSHATLMTGTWPWEHNADWAVPMDPYLPTLAERLAARGYVTAAFVANVVYTSKETGLDRGFAVYRDNPADFPEFLMAHWGTRALLGFYNRLIGNHLSHEHKDGLDQNREVLDWVDRVDGRPVFLALNYFDAHHPYQSPAPFNTRFSESPPRAALTEWCCQAERPVAEFDEQRLAYESAIAYMDDVLRQLFEGLDARGLLDNTVVVVTSDHGEHFGEHGLTLHGNSLSYPTLHVPLFILGPGIGEGARIPETVSLRDVPATILDLAGAPPGLLPGASLAPLWSSAGAGVGVSPAFAKLVPGNFFMDFFPTSRGTLLSLTDGGLHYVLNGDGVEELYDVVADPEESHDLASDPDYQERLVGLRNLVRSVPLNAPPEPPRQ